jgi:hypothetical protein
LGDDEIQPVPRKRLLPFGRSYSKNYHLYLTRADSFGLPTPKQTKDSPRMAFQTILIQQSEGLPVIVGIDMDGLRSVCRDFAPTKHDRRTSSFKLFSKLQELICGATFGPDGTHSVGVYSTSPVAINKGFRKAELRIQLKVSNNKKVPQKRLATKKRSAYVVCPPATLPRFCKSNVTEQRWK